MAVRISGLRSGSLPVAGMLHAFVAGWCIFAGSSVLAAPGDHFECRGEIVSAATGQPLSFEAFADRLQSADVVLFGEVHGVEEHARASACVLSALVEDERPAGLVMEIFSTDDQPAIDLYRKSNPEHAAGLAAALEWWARGWPAFESWLPLIDRAFGLRVDVIGGDIGVSVSQPGAQRLFEKRLGDDLENVRKTWTRAMERAHCGLIGAKEAERLGERQISRDLSMADAALSARQQLSGRMERGAGVLIHAGRGHVRKDRSLYKALIRETQKGDATVPEVLSIGALTEAEAPGSQESGAHDYYWISGNAVAGDKACDLFGKVAIGDVDAGGLKGEAQKR